MLKSKKFWAAVTAALVAIIGDFFEIPRETVLAVVGPIVAYIVAQGIADAGKEAVKIEIEAANGG